VIPPLQFISARFIRAEDRVWNERLYAFRKVASVAHFETDYLIAYTNGDIENISAIHAVPVAVNRQLADEWMIAVQEERNG
jgi:hypothetical protein